MDVTYGVLGGIALLHWWCIDDVERNMGVDVCETIVR